MKLGEGLAASPLPNNTCLSLFTVVQKDPSAKILKVSVDIFLEHLMVMVLDCLEKGVFLDEPKKTSRYVEN